MSTSLRCILTWIVTLLVPVVLVLASVMIVLNPWYLDIEYRTPGFPEDEYGFTLSERLQYSRVARDYLLNDADISFLGELRFPAGQEAPPQSCQFMDDCTKLYNQSELDHMVDAKNLLRIVLRIWYISLLLLAVLGIWAWRGKWLGDFSLGLGRGGWLMVLLIGLLFALVIFAFGIIFVAFHEVFFEAGTWIFYTSDTLIRLFPERFWRDTFLVVGGLSALMGLGLGLAFRRKRAIGSDSS